MVAPICFVQAAVLIANYQGNVLHLANDINPTARPIVTMPRAVPTIPNETQQWKFSPIDESGDTEFVVQSSQQTQPSDNIFIGYQSVSSQFLQAAGVGDPIFNLQCINSTAGAMIDRDSGLALTAWSIVGNDFSAPVTYEVYTGAPSQIWNFVAM